MTASPNRCPWSLKTPLETIYHDEEWGVPVHDDRVLFEFLVLESAQAGLSWSTVLQKREGYRTAFANFDPVRVATFTPEDEARLLREAPIVRNRAKIAATVSNARCFLEIQAGFGSFDAYVWAFIGNGPRINQAQSPADVPAVTEESEKLARDLKKRGFRFLGPTILYAYMQAVGMVNDHLVSCFRHPANR